MLFIVNVLRVRLDRIKMAVNFKLWLAGCIFAMGMSSIDES